MGVTGNKTELAHRLGVTRSTLSTWLLRYGADFPIVEPGTNGRDYVFDFTDVFEFLRAKREEQERTQAERDEQLAQLKLPFAVPGADTGAPRAFSPKEELEAWRLRRLQREEAERAGALVPTETVLEAFGGALARLSRDTHAFLRQLGREQGWPAAYMRSVETRFGDTQRAAVKDLERNLGTAPAEPRDLECST